MQRTLKSPIFLNGVGLHSGENVNMSVRPAFSDTGIWFKRTDISGVDNMIPALWDYAQQTQLCTRIVNEAGIAVSTIEHLMAALYGCGIHNAIVEIDGPEVPILDGSAVEFVEHFLKAGIVRQSAAVRALKVLKNVTVKSAGAWASLVPSSVMEMDFHIDFNDPAIGVQKRTMTLANGAFVHALCDSRTFCQSADVDAMRAQGLVKGGNLNNAVVFDGHRVLSPGGLRHRDEPVRHKMLDAVGDLALAGVPILGKYIGYKAGHAISNQLLHAVFADASNYEMIECDAQQTQLLPGSGIVSADLPVVA